MNDDRDRAAVAREGSTSFELLAATSPHPLALLDRSGRVLRAERRAAQLLGRPAAELEGECVETFLEARDRFAFRKALSVFAPDRPPPERGRQPIRVRGDVPRRDGEPVPVEFGLRSLPGADELVVLSLRDRSGSGGELRRSVRPLLASTLDGAAVGVLATDLDGEPLYFNRRFAELWGLPPHLARRGDGDRAVEHVHRRLVDPRGFRRRTAAALREPDREHRDRAELDDGRVVERRIRPRRVQGRLAGHVFTFREVSGPEEDVDATGGTEDRDRLLFEHNVAGVFRISLDGRILEVNRAFAEIFGYDDPADLEGADAGQLYADPRARSRFRKRLRESGSVHNYELECRRRDGSSVWLLENSLLVDDPEAGDEVVVGTVIDISRRKRLEQELERMAYHDSLTGLPNRRLLREQAGQVVALAERGDHRVGLVYLDMARFKQVNDTLGHDAGDEVLKEVARRLDDHLRESDMASRVGGDEFAVLLSEVTDAEGAMAAAGRLRRIFRKPFEVKGERHELDARLGVALYPDHAADFDALLTAADHAMYQVRSGDRDGVVLFDPGAAPSHP
jgi:diguanylate cyclase (GGDEF)-like protein/PAS domain S-box-containing protein